jgi:gliding motility-associated-like protein
MKNIYRKYFLCCFLIFFLLKNINSQTVLNRGDLVIVAVNANLASSGTLNTKDEISFVCFKPITPGTEIQILDAGYENCLSGLWSCGQEGGAKFTRTGATIAAGTVITFRNTSPYTFLSPDNGWAVTDLYIHPTNTNYSVLFNDFNINAGGDQIYFAQGGTWSELSSLCTINGSRTSPNATFPGNNGRILFGFSTSGSWLSQQQSSGESGLYPGMSCFSMAPTSNSAYNKYTGPLTAANQTTWISRISNPSNWSSYSTSALYASSGTNYAGGFNILINNGGDIPTATWTAPSGTICSNSSNINLNSLITGTSGGTWSGTGVTGSTFNPTGLNGTYQITYTVNYISGTSSCPISQTNSITVNATPAAPTVTTPITYCQNATAAALTATGSNLLWYTTATGGTGSTNVPTPSTTTSGSTNYYVSQTVSSCESPRASILVTIKTTPSAPTVTTPIAYCQNATASALSAVGTNLLWYTSATGGTGSTNVSTPSTTTSGSTNYYVSQTVSSCESPRANIAVTVNATPTAPTVTTPITYCQNATASALSAVGTNLLWYTSATGGTGSTTQPTPITTAAGNTNYYVSQTVSGCESPTASITVNVNAAPTINAVSNQTVCTNTSTTPINFSGIGTNIFNWTNNNTAIGLAANGTGNIASFTALNTGTTPITATITATPVPSSFAYIANYGSITSFPLSNTVTVINTNTNAITGTITVGNNPFGVSASSDGTKVYVTNYGGNSVSVINTSTNTVVNTIGVGSQPMGIVVSPDGSRVYVANQLSNTLSVINTTTNTIVATIPISLQPQGVTISPDGSKVYVVNVNSNNVSVINTATNTVITTIGVGTQPITAAISPDGSRLYVTNFGSNNTSIINTSTNSVITSVPVGFAPNGIAVTPDGMKVYVTNQLSGNVSIINTATNTLSATISVGSNPQGISFTADGSKAYVANFGSGNVSVINTNTNTVSATIAVGSVPHSLGNFISQTGICSGLPTTFTITVNPLPVATFIYPANIFCTVGTATPTITGTLGGTFSSSSGLIINATTGVINLAASTPGFYTITYTLTVGNCTITPTATITINAIPNAPIVNSPVTYCQNTIATALTANGTNLLWYNLPNGSIGSNTSPTPSTTSIGSTNFYVTQTINNCESPQATISVNVASAPAIPTITPAGPIRICTDTSTILYSSAAIDNQWYKDGVLISGATNNSLLITEVGNYTVKVTNSNGCSNISSGLSVAVFATPTVSAGPDKSVFQGDSVQLISTVSGGALFNYLWTPSIYLSDNTIANPWVKNPLTDTTYKLTVTNENGCRASSSVKVKVLRDLKIPNVFSPNSDGLHDTWDITNLNLYPNSSVEIFNRNGQIVFQSKGYSTPWDGRKNGSPVPVGVYYYIINTGNGKPLKSGWLTILR